MSVHSLITRFQSRSCTVGMEASAIRTATVMNVPTIACAPIFWILSIGAAGLYLHPYVGGVIYRRSDRGCEKLSCGSW